jgi:hypothetical protein
MNDQLTRDVAARRRAEAVLREREGRIRRLIDANIIGICTRGRRRIGLKWSLAKSWAFRHSCYGT